MAVAQGASAAKGGGGSGGEGRSGGGGAAMAVGTDDDGSDGESYASMPRNKRPTQQRALSAHVLKLDFTDGSTVDVPELYNTSLSVKWDFREPGSSERVTWLQQILKGSKEPRTPEPNPTPHPRHRHRPHSHSAPSYS